MCIISTISQLLLSVGPWADPFPLKVYFHPHSNLRQWKLLPSKFPNAETDTLSLVKFPIAQLGFKLRPLWLICFLSLCYLYCFLLHFKYLEHLWWGSQNHGASLVAQTVKNLPAVQETWFRSPGQEDPLEKGMATHSSILAWRIPWTKGPSGLQSMGLQRVGHDWAMTHTYTGN